jgi:NO-binding membrane sensor protein with MHYT domain
LKVALYNLLLFIAYTALLMILFALNKNPNPIGIGIWQTISIFLHFISIIAYWLIIKATIRLQKRILSLLVSIAGLAVALLFYYLFENKIWEFFWQLRP